MHAQRTLARKERHQNSDVAVARVERFVGASVYGRDFHHARHDRRRRRRGNRAITTSLPTGKPASCAARTLPPEIFMAKPKVVRSIRNQANRQATIPKIRP